MKTFIKEDFTVIRSEESLDLKTIQIGSALVTLLGKFLGVIGKKKSVPITLLFEGVQYYLTMRWQPGHVELGYFDLSGKNLFTVTRVSEKEAKKAMHEFLIQKGYVI